jgi:hypothetical protein
VPLPIMNVRRMAALDMWGSAGGRRRRLVIRWEFVVGVFGCFALGALVLASTSSSLWLLIGVWLIGAGINYAPLAAYATTLSRPGALERELESIDTRRELRRAGVHQLWIAVPCSVALAALIQERQRKRARANLTH